MAIVTNRGTSQWYSTLTIPHHWFYICVVISLLAYTKGSHGLNTSEWRCT